MADAQSMAIILRWAGVYARAGALGPELIRDLREARRTRHAGQLGVLSAGQEAKLDSSMRKTSSVQLPEALLLRLKEKLGGYRDEISRFFSCPLTGLQNPELLLYEQGYFFTRHRDRGKGGYDGYDERGVGERRVSVVTLVASENLKGGQLVLYGLRGARLLGLFGMEMRLPVEFAPDLMVAFRADTEHEVKPVIAGERISAVTWFV